MAEIKLDEHEEICVGDRIEVIADNEEEGCFEGETGDVEEITKYTETMNDRIAIYVRIDGTVDPIEIPAMDLAAIS